MFNPFDLIFRRRAPSVLGLDIGTSSIKIVEVKREENRFKLLNYAELEIAGYRDEQGFRGLSFDLRDVELAEKIRVLLREGGFTASVAVMSLPVFSTFVTVMDMPMLSEKELATAVPLQAREYIPIPVSEVVLDWKIIRTTKRSDLVRAGAASAPAMAASPAPPGADASRRSGAHTEVLLMAAPQEMVQKYSRVAELAKLELMALEIEVFSLARAALAGDDQNPSVLVDIGALNTSVSVVDGGFLRVVHNVEISGVDLSRAVSRALGVDLDRGEYYKRGQGLFAAGGETEVVSAYLPLLEALSRDIERVVSAYWRRSSRQVSQIVLAGRSSMLKGLAEYLSGRVRIPTALANPFRVVALPRDLAPSAPQLGLELSTAIGSAMKEY